MHHNYRKRCKAGFRSVTRETANTCLVVVTGEINFGTDSEVDPSLLARNEPVERAPEPGAQAIQNDSLNSLWHA